MSSASRLVILAILLLFAVAIAWWRMRDRHAGDSSTPVIQTPAELRLSPKGMPPETPHGIVQPYARTPYLGLTDPRWIERNRLRALDPAYEWRTPIEFFGKVVDEALHPVGGATVETTWSGTEKTSAGDGVGHRSLISDEDGNFALIGVRGKGISVRVSKEGYHVPGPSNMQWFEYAGFWEPTFIEPDRNNPVVFRLVKRREAEPTYRIGTRLFLQPPALETEIDLLSPTVQAAAPADISVRFTRSPNANYEKPLDWSITIEGRNGAEVAESKDEFMLEAPADGYQQKIFHQFKQAPANKRENIRFYVRNPLRNLYAAVEFEAVPYRRMEGSEPASIIVTATVNPNDSPNLEYDEKKDLRASQKRQPQ